MIGCGYWGPNLVRNFSSLPECSVKYVSDIKPGRLEYIKKEYPFIDVTTDYCKIFNDSSIDAVAIATDVKTHKKFAIEAIEAGKHIFVEKPLAYSVKEAKEIVDIAKKYNKILAVGHVFQFAPAVRKIKQLLKNNVIGEILHISSTRINLGPPETDVDVIWDLGPHDFSIILHLLEDFPSEIKCKKESYPFSFMEDRHKDKKIANNAHIDLTFNKVITSHVHLSWLSANKIRYMQIFGTKGTIVYDEMLALDGKLKLYGTGEDNRLDNSSGNGKLNYNPGQIQILQLEQHEPLRMECEDFILSIMNGKKLINDGNIGLNVIRIIEATENNHF